MIPSLFGTDGIRGLWGSPPLDPPSLVALGDALGRYLEKNHPSSRRGSSVPTLIFAQDTRASCQALKAYVRQGLQPYKVQVWDLGCLPTPGVSFFAWFLEADLGIMVSASHNDGRYNGMKFFYGDGRKWSQATEKEITDLYHSSDPRETPSACSHRLIWQEKDPKWVQDRFQAFLLEKVHALRPKKARGGESSSPWRSLKIVVDSAHGAYSGIAASVLEALGAQVIALGDKPDGLNINDQCGALYPDLLQKKVQEVGAYGGIALDGDGDRVLVVDEKGSPIPGDQILGFLGAGLAKRKKLPHKAVVGTQLTSLGLEKYLESLGIFLYRSQVGDRHVAQMMHQIGSSLGGEPSGHLVIQGAMTTGDGLLNGILLLEMALAQGKPLSEIFPIFTPSQSYEASLRAPIDQDFASFFQGKIDALHQEPWFQAFQKEFSSQGRWIFRLSGTEPVLRLWLDTLDLSIALKAWGDRIQDFIQGT